MGVLLFGLERSIKKKLRKERNLHLMERDLRKTSRLIPSPVLRKSKGILMLIYLEQVVEKTGLGAPTDSTRHKETWCNHVISSVSEKR